MGDGAASILAFLAILRNDITNIEGINLTEAYTLPNTFSVTKAGLINAVSGRVESISFEFTGKIE